MENITEEELITPIKKGKSFKSGLFYLFTTLTLIALIDCIILLGLNKTGIVNINSTIEHIPVLSIFKNEEKEVDIKSKKIEELTTQLETIQNELDIKNADLIKVTSKKDSLEKENSILKDKISKLEKEKEKDSPLSKYYTDMKPKAAAAIFNNMKESLIVEIINDMDESSVSQILQNMEASKATKVTELYKKIYS